MAALRSPFLPPSLFTISNRSRRSTSSEITMYSLPKSASTLWELCETRYKDEYINIYFNVNVDWGAIMETDEHVCIRERKISRNCLPYPSNI